MNEDRSARPTSGAPVGALTITNDAFAGDGEMSALMRRFDWESTPLGSPESWPQSLRTIVRVLLTSRFAMWMGWGPDLVFLYNDAYGRMTLGRKHPWALGRPAREVWAEIWDDIGPRIRKVIATGVATWDEALQLFLERSGYTEETYHTFSYSPLTNDAGVVAGMFCVVSEETDRVIGERRLASLRDLASDLATTSTEEQVVQAIEQSLGSNPRDLPFTLVYLYTDDTSRAELAATTGLEPGHTAAPESLALDDPAAPWPAAAIAGGTGAVVIDDLGTRFDGLPTGAWDIAPTRATVVPIAKQGQERPAGFLVAGLNPYRQLDDSYAGFVHLVAGQIASSLANARAYEEERRRAEALAELDRAKTTFFSNVSHEFRTPLTLMLGPAEDALLDELTTAENRERASVIHRNALRLLKLVNTMLDFSRIEAGRMQASYEATDLSSYTAELASNFRSATERAGLRLVVDCPPLSRPASVDRDMWEKIVLNLLSNAFKHTFEGEITVRTFERDGRAVLQVQDTGVGIPVEQLPRIFERFHRVPSARSRTHEGTGIGLALVQELVRLHNGTIQVDSTMGVGTTFTVSVPFGVTRDMQPTGHASVMGREAAVQATAFVEEALRWLPNQSSTDAAPATRMPSAESGVAPPASSSPRVLVADDNSDMREYVARLLRGRGWQVDTVGDGFQALARVREQTPDLVLSDVMMPGLDGFGLLRELRDDPLTRALPVILLSARAGEDAKVEGIEAGATDYLVKPFSARELLSRVESQILRSREAAAERRITHERERLLKAVQAERARLQELLAQAPAAIAVLHGPNHVFQSANHLYEQLVGNRPLIGKGIREALPELEGQGIFELLDTVRATGEPYVGRALRVMVDADGDGVPDERFFTFVYQPIREQDNVAGIFIHAMDVTDQVRAVQEAEAANRAKSEFLAAMSHELRTPLNAIGGYAQLIEMGLHGPVTTAQHGALERVRRSQQHLLSLINDVLNFAKLEAGRVEYDISEVNLAEVAEGVVPMVEPQLTPKGLTCEVRVESGLRARADREKLEQILLNLLSNSAKFTGQGGRIVIDAPSRGEDGAPPGGHVYLRVTDNGIGIAREKQEVIFEPFVQVQRRLTSPTEGTGLGLAISRDLARGMGGDLRVRSEEGKGARFTLSLPAV